MEVTRLHGMSVIDAAGMVFGREPKTYLDDQHHPNKVCVRVRVRMHLCVTPVSPACQGGPFPHLPYPVLA